MIGTDEQAAPGWRRVAAFGVDYAVVVLYLGFLGLVGALGRAVGVTPSDVATPAGRAIAQLVAFVLLTLPVTVWFASWEAAPPKATPGKRLLRLQVVTAAGDRMTWTRSLFRTTLKFTVPWELAHTALWNMLVWPGDPDDVLNILLLVASNAVIAVDLVSLFVGMRRTPHDRIAGTVVVDTGDVSLTLGRRRAALR